MFEQLIWLVPLVVAALGAWRPTAGLVALAAALPFFGSPPGGPYLGALDAAGLAAIATCWRAGRPPPTPLAWPALAFVAVGLTSLLPSPYLPPSWSPGILLRLAQVLPGVEGWTALYTWRAAADLLLGWGLFVSARRAFAGRSVRPLALGFLAGVGTAVVFGFAEGWGLVDLAAYRPQFRSPEAQPRIASLFFLSGWLAEYLVVATPLALAAVATRLGRWRHLAPVVLSLSLGCLLLARQRGGWLAAAVQLGAAGGWLLLQRGRHGWTRVDGRRALVTAVAILAVAGMVVVAAGDVDEVVDRAISIREGSAARLALWRAAVEMTRQRPLLGWGVGSFAPVFDLLNPPGSPNARENHGTAHNLYLHTAAETGALGLAALALLGWAAAVCLKRPRQGQEPAAFALGICLIGIAVYGLVQHMLYLRVLGWALWLLLGCAAVVSRRDAGAPPARWAQGLALLALVLVPVRLALVEPAPLAGSRELGLHEPEGDGHRRLRWTEGFAAVRLAVPGNDLELYFANGHPKAGARPIEVVVGVDGRVAERVSVPGGWQRHAFEIEPSGPREVVLTIEARPPFRPFSDYLSYPDLRRSNDIRTLGVAVKLPGDPPPG